MEKFIHVLDYIMQSHLTRIAYMFIVILVCDLIATVSHIQFIIVLGIAVFLNMFFIGWWRYNVERGHKPTWPKEKLK